MKKYHLNIHAAENEKKEREKKIKREKEGMGEQKNRSTFGSLLQDTRERERGRERETGNNNDDGDSYGDNDDGDSYNDDDDGDSFYDDDEIKESIKTVEWHLTGNDNTFADAYDTPAINRISQLRKQKESGDITN